MAIDDIDKRAVVDDGAVIGEGSKIWHFCHILRNTMIDWGGVCLGKTSCSVEGVKALAALHGM